MFLYTRVINTLLFCIILLCQLNGQSIYRVGPEHADCKNAIHIYDTIFGPTTPPSGYGKIMEFNSYLGDPYSFEKEHNTVWYRFTVPRTCDLLFDIIPTSIDDDYDFLLYRWKGDNTCELIKNREITPVRSCISRNDPSIGSRTGLSYDAEKDFINAGPGASYANALPVEKGESYILVLDNVYPNGDGHTLHLKYRNCKEEEPDNAVEPSNYLNLTVRNSETFEKVKANIYIINRSRPRSEQDTTFFEMTENIFIKLDRQSVYEIIARSPGYFQQTDQLRTYSDYQTYLKTMHITKIEENKSISFNNILFHGGSDKFLRESFTVLDDIIQTLKDHPGIEVEVIGHVNAPHQFFGRTSRAQNQSLSDRRAKAVYDYLIRKGISTNRLSWSGKSNREMIYPYAETEEEMQANRRVEILIKRYDQSLE